MHETTATVEPAPGVTEAETVGVPPDTRRDRSQSAGIDFPLRCLLTKPKRGRSLKKQRIVAQRRFRAGQVADLAAFGRYCNPSPRVTEFQYGADGKLSGRVDHSATSVSEVVLDVRSALGALSDTDTDFDAILVKVVDRTDAAALKAMVCGTAGSAQISRRRPNSRIRRIEHYF